MDFLTYLYPREYVAQVVVWVQVIGFALWSTELLYFFIRDLRLRRSINNFDVRALRPAAGETDDTGLFAGSSAEDRGYRSISNRFLTYHLSALDASGRNGRPLDVAGLINNTASGLVSNNTWLKSTLSLFIIIGLLGTLWGLASSLNQLSTMTPDGSQITNETLSLGLNALLSKLGGAFAPSIFGVAFTILGVLLFALYTRAGSIPLVGALERQTITLWAPALIKQGPDVAVLMRDNIKAAEQIGIAAATISTNVEKLVSAFNENLPDLVKNLTESIGTISEKLSTEATNLSDDVSNARSSLKALTDASENLNKFSGTFKNSVEKLYPFSDATELRSLYEKLLERSTGILENHETFQQLVLDQLNQITEQKVLFNQGLSSFSENVDRASASIVREIGGTASAAKDAFSRLTEQNQDVIREIVRQVGSPITELLEPIPETLTVLNQEIRRINTPLESVKDSIAKSSNAVIDYATQRMGRIEDKLQSQVTNLEGLTSSVDGLVPKVETLSERIDGFNTKTDKFSASIVDFGGSAAALTGKFERFDQKADEVIRATRVAPKSPPRDPAAASRAPQKKKGIFSGIRSKLFGE